MEDLWDLVLGAARSAERLAQAGVAAPFADGIAWSPARGFETTAADDDPRRAVFDLYLPICSATAAQPMTVGHLGQSLDGFIATHAGESKWVTGEENMLHMHRMRALCDAVIVGAGTVAADDPQLTTRLVEGEHPVRVVFDPGRRLGDHHRVFSDETAETLYACAGSLVQPGEREFGRAAILPVAGRADGSVDVADLIQRLRARGYARIFVEGGGVTVSMLLEADLLDRLHMAVAPLLIGNGRPAIRLPARAALVDCHRPRYRVFRMGGDVLFDLDLRAGDDTGPAGGLSPIARVI